MKMAVVVEDGSGTAVDIEDTSCLIFVDSVDRATVIVEEYERQTCSRFISASVSKDFGKSVVAMNIKAKKIYWNKDYKDETAASTPYIIVGQKVLDCQYGKDPDTAKKAKYQVEKEKKKSPVSYLCLMPCKKVDCPARIVLRDVVYFIDFKIPQDTKHHRQIMGRKLKVNFKVGKIIRHILVNLPATNEHRNHSFGEEDDLSQRVDPKVSKKIEELLVEGVTSINEIEKHLKSFVTLQQFPGQSIPSPSNRRYFPSRKTIRAKMYKFTLQQKRTFVIGQQGDVRISEKDSENDLSRHSELDGISEEVVATKNSLIELSEVVTHEMDLEACQQFKGISELEISTDKVRSELEKISEDLVVATVNDSKAFSEDLVVVTVNDLEAISEDLVVATVNDLEAISEKLVVATVNYSKAISEVSKNTQVGRLSEVTNENALEAQSELGIISEVFIVTENDLRAISEIEVATDNHLLAQVGRISEEPDIDLEPHQEIEGVILATENILTAVSEEVVTENFLETHTEIAYNLKQAMAIVKEYERKTLSKFISKITPKDFGKPDAALNLEAKKVYWDDSYIKDQTGSTPYIHISQKQLECQYGKTRDEAKNLKRKGGNKTNEDCGVSTRGWQSKKVDCPATIVIRDLVYFTDFKIKDSKYHREVMSKKLKATFKSKQALRITRHFIINLPSIHDHRNHTPGQVTSPPQKRKRIHTK